MDAFDKLKSLVSIKGLDLSKLESVSIIKDAKDVSLFKLNNNRVNLTINIESSDLKNEQTKREIQSFIRAALHEDGVPVLEESADQEVQLIGAAAASSTVDFFRDKISPTDLLILKTAFYIQQVYEVDRSKGARLKHDLIERYGERGNNLANLCSAGYFESYFVPLYKALAARPDFELSEFQQTFDFIVRTAPFTVFVSRTKGSAATMQAVLDKVERAKRYGVSELNIHGIGAENIQTIKEIAEDEAIAAFFSASPSITIKGDVAHLKIFLREK